MANAMAQSATPVLEVFRPVIRAYALVYFSTSSFHVVRLVPAIISKKQNIRWFIRNALRSIRDSARLDKFPAYAALLIAASTIIPRMILEALPQLPPAIKTRIAHLTQTSGPIRFLSVFIISSYIFQVLNEGSIEPLKSAEITAGYAEAITTRVGPVKGGYDPIPLSPVTQDPPVGKTLFITSFSAIHALTVLGALGLDALRTAAPKNSPRRESIANFKSAAAPLVFAISSSVIMWSWFYTPERLPKEYSAWITSAAQVDMRLIRTMRESHLGIISYGKLPLRHTGMSDIVKDYSMPAEWADYTKTIPIPCELVHCGAGPSCEVHALHKFLKGWTFAMRMYLPLNMFFVIQGKRNTKSLLRAILSASRSSAFLGAFTGFFYYGICLGRTRIGPLLLGNSPEAYNKLEQSAATRLASILCGLSIWIERASRRKEMALFVAPRALSALLPRRYDRKYLWIEQLTFGASVATILTAAKAAPWRVQGVFGRLLSKVYA